MFKALLLDKTDGRFGCTPTELDESRLPEGDVLVRPAYSTLNYKDALAITNKAPVVRSWPMVPGIDGAGTVLESTHPDWHAGDRFVHNGWGVGETHWGCLAQRARLKGDWLVKLPAGFHATPGDGHRHRRLHRDAVRDGARAPRPAARRRRGAGHRRHRRRRQRRDRRAGASRPPRHRRQRQAAGGRLPAALGATAVIDRAEFATAGKPLQKERWAGVVDALGSHTLANALAQTRYGGTSPPAAWRRAWTCRAAWRPSSCAA
jgi:acrylyl-CoA reductase (NADPH)